jgi:hypothetical protein
VKLHKRVEDGTVKGGQVLRGERASIDEIKTRILKSGTTRTFQNFEQEEVDAEEEICLIKQDEKYVDLWRKATVAHESIAKTLWQYNLSKDSTIQFLESSSDYKDMEE